MTKSVVEMAVGGKPKPGFPPTLETGPQTGAPFPHRPPLEFITKKNREIQFTEQLGLDCQKKRTQS